MKKDDYVGIMQDALNKHFRQSASSAADIDTRMTEFRGALALINERGRGTCARADALVDAAHTATGITYDEWVEYGRVLRDTWYYGQHHVALPQTLSQAARRLAA